MKTYISVPIADMISVLRKLEEPVSITPGLLINTLGEIQAADRDRDTHCRALASIVSLVDSAGDSELKEDVAKILRREGMDYIFFLERKDD